jgi:hypothetical protein
VFANPFAFAVLEIYCCPVNVLEPVVAYFDSIVVTLLLILDVKVLREAVDASIPANLVFALLV